MLQIKNILLIYYTGGYYVLFQLCTAQEETDDERRGQKEVIEKKPRKLGAKISVRTVTDRNWNCIGCYNKFDNGISYNGTASSSTIIYISIDGRNPNKTCLNWNYVDSPNWPYREDNNFCQNQDAKTFRQPWCYTNKTTYEFRYCDIPVCDCRRSGDALDYDGKINETMTGKTCGYWSLTRYPNLEKNYCRTPPGDQDNKGGPWCYLADNSGWEHCDVPICKSQCFIRFEDPNLLTIDGKNRYQEGEYVYFTCKNGGNLIGWKVLTCLSQGVLNSSLPSCDDCRRTVDALDYDGKINVTRTGKPCANWSQTRYSNQTKNFCRTPSGDRDNAGGPWCYVADKSGWEYCNVPVCKSQYCHRFNDPNLLSLDGKDRYQEGETVHLKCKTSYNLKGQNVLTCMQNGRWNFAEPMCEGKQCPPLYVTYMKRIETGYRFPESLLVSCKDGYESLSKDPVICTSDGTWSSIPLCIGKPCQPLNVANMNQLKTDYRFPESFTVSCRDGYTSNSREPVYCTSNGTWSRIPMCKAMGESSAQTLPVTEETILPAKGESSFRTDPVISRALWPVIGAVAGLVVINSVSICVIFCRRRNIRKKHVAVDYEKPNIQTNKEGDTFYDEICPKGTAVNYCKSKGTKEASECQKDKREETKQMSD